MLATLLQCILVKWASSFPFMPKVMRHCKKFRDVHFDPDALPPLTHSFESELFEPNRIQ
ncbi:hypothetical protein ACLK19_29580 [Escherichia coli]